MLIKCLKGLKSQKSLFVKILKWPSVSESPRVGIELPGQLKTAFTSLQTLELEFMLRIHCRQAFSLVLEGEPEYRRLRKDEVITAAEKYGWGRHLINLDFDALAVASLGI